MFLDLGGNVVPQLNRFRLCQAVVICIDFGVGGQSPSDESSFRASPLDLNGSVVLFVI